MPKRTFNYTGRVGIKQKHVFYSAREVAGASPVATVGLELDDYEFPADAEIYVEAYRGAGYMRESLGTIGAWSERREFVLREFDTPEEVKLRVKIVGRRDDVQGGPLLIGVADQISATEGEDQEHDIEKLLSMMPDDLNGEIWRVEVEDNGPVLFLERAYWEQRQFVKSGWFFPLVVPSILREGIRAALAEKYRELDEDTWQSRWLNLAMQIPVDQDLPGEEAEQEEIDSWIDQRVEAFCRDQKMPKRIAAYVQGGDQ